MSQSSAILDHLRQLEDWLHKAIRHYVSHATGRFEMFKPLLVLSDDDHLGPAVSQYFFSLNDDLRLSRFRLAVGSAAESLHPTDPYFTSAFAAYCEIAAYVGAAAIVRAIDAHFLLGPLRNARTESQFEAANMAIQALHTMSPRVPAAANLIRQLYGDPDIRSDHNTALMSAMSEIEPSNWPKYVRDFTKSAIFRLHMRLSAEKLSHPLDAVSRSIRPQHFANSLWQLVDLLAYPVAELAFKAFFRTRNAPYVLFTGNFFEYHFPDLSGDIGTPPHEHEWGSRWYITTRKNFDRDRGLPTDPTGLVEVTLSPGRTIATFAALLKDFANDVQTELLLSAA